MQGAVAIFQYKDGLKNGHELDLEVQKIVGGIVFATGCVLVLCYGKIFQSIYTYTQSKDGKSTITAEFHACSIALAVAVGFIVFTFPVGLLPYVLINEENGELGLLVAECLLLFNSVFNPTVYFWRKYIIKLLRKCTFIPRQSRKSDSIAVLSRINTVESVATRSRVNTVQSEPEMIHTQPLHG